MLNVTKIHIFFSPVISDPGKRWKKIATMKSARAFAASVVLADGRLWILGGLGIDSILKSTEILEETSVGLWKVFKGPDLTTTLFGHCVAALPNGKVLLSGGFDGGDQSDITKEFQWHDEITGQWSTKPWSPMKTKRYDHACYMNGESVYLAGGWNADISKKLKAEQYNTTSRQWDEATAATMDTELPDILRSVTVGISEGKIALIGGVSCKVHSDLRKGRNCTKHKEVYELHSMGWKKSTKEIGVPRSSHAGAIVHSTIDFSCAVPP